MMDFNLVCDRKWEQELSQLLLMFGVLLGAMFCGIGSDKYAMHFVLLPKLLLFQ